MNGTSCNLKDVISKWTRHGVQVGLFHIGQNFVCKY